MIKNVSDHNPKKKTALRNRQSGVAPSEQRRIEKVLQENEERMNRAQEIAHLGSWELDLVNNHLSWSDEVYRIFGLQPQEFEATYEAFLDAVHPDDRAAVNAAYSGSLREGRDTYEIEHRVVRKLTGEVRIVHEKCEHIRDESGLIIRSVGMVHDITERKQADDALRAVYARYRSFIEVTDQIGWTTNPAGEVVEDMPEWRNYTGQSFDDIKGWGWSKALHPDDLDHTSEVWKKSVREKSKYEVEYRIRRHDGVYRHFIARGTPVFKEDGTIREWVGTCIDITERKQAEEALTKAKLEWERTFDSVPDMIAILDDKHRIMQVNRAMAEQLGLKSEECVGLPCYKYVHGLSAPPAFCPHSHTLKDGRQHIFELCEERLGGDMLVSTTPILNDRGEITGSVHVARNISELKQRETEVTALLEASRAVMEQHDFKDTARLIFNSCKKLIGATAGYVALLSKDGNENEVLFLDAGGAPCTVDPSLPMPVRGLRRTAYSSGKTVYENDFPLSEWVKFMPEGHAALDNVMFAPLIIGTETVGILGLANKKGGFTDNDARMASAFGELASIALHNSRLFELLKNNEQKFRSVVQTASDAIISVDGHGNIISWNRGAELIIGYSADEVTGKPIKLITPEGSAQDYQTGIKDVVTSGSLSFTGKRFETMGLRKDGSKFPLEMSVARWKTGEGTFFTEIIRDITERKQAEEERERLLEELARSNRELEQFAYIASHDLQEPLRMVSSYVELLSHRYKDRLDSDADEFIGYAVSGAAYMQTLLNDLLAYSRVGASGRPFALTDLNSVFKITAVNLKKLIDDSHAEIKHESLPAVYADDIQMVQVFQNLIGNAIKFRSKEPPHVNITADLENNEWVVRVSDNGIGIDPKYFNRVFHIFKRIHSRDKYDGTGIGLAICKKIVERHGGRIWVESEPGKGSTFYFTIPVSSSLPLAKGG